MSSEARGRRVCGYCVLHAAYPFIALLVLFVSPFRFWYWAKIPNMAIIAAWPAWLIFLPPHPAVTWRQSLPTLLGGFLIWVLPAFLFYLGLSDYQC
jgi:hypothetical protein